MAMSPNKQPAKHSVPHQPKTLVSSGQQQQQYSQQHSPQPRPGFPPSSVGTTNQGKRMEQPPAMDKQMMRPQMRPPLPGQSRMPSSPHSQDRHSFNQIPRPHFSHEAQRKITPLAPNFLTKSDAVSGSSSKVYGNQNQMNAQHASASHHQEMLKHKQNMNFPPKSLPGYDDDCSDEEDYDNEEDMYGGYHGPPGYDFDSSDDDDDGDLSEEEKALLDELRHCDGDKRVQIMNKLKAKGIDQDEIEELLCQNSDPDQMMYPEDKYYDDEYDDTGVVSSSSQGHLSTAANQFRPHHPHKTGAVPEHGGPSVRSVDSPFGRNPRSLPASGSDIAQQGTTPYKAANPRDRAGFHKYIPPRPDLYKEPKEKGLPAQLSTPQSRLPRGPLLPSEHKHKGHHIPVSLSKQSSIVQSTSSPEVKQPSNTTVKIPKEPPNLKTDDNVHSRDENCSSFESESFQACQSAKIPIGSALPQDDKAISSVKPTTGLCQNTKLQAANPDSPRHGSIPSKTAALQSSEPSTPPHKSHFNSVRRSLQGQEDDDTEDLPDSHRSNWNARPSVERSQDSKHFPDSRTTLSKDAIPSEAKLARLKVEMMQQSLDQEIMVKKGFKSTPGNRAHSQHQKPSLPRQQSPAQNIPKQPLRNQSLASPPSKSENRLASPPPKPDKRLASPPPKPEKSSVFSPPKPEKNSVFSPSKPEVKTSLAHQSKHQLLPPSPHIPTSGIEISGPKTVESKPVCSVVPFTFEDSKEAEALVAGSTKPRETFLRPLNPPPSVAKEAARAFTPVLKVTPPSFSSPGYAMAKSFSQLNPKAAPALQVATGEQNQEPPAASLPPPSSPQPASSTHPPTTLQPSPLKQSLTSPQPSTSTHSAPSPQPALGTQPSTSTYSALSTQPSTSTHPAPLPQPALSTQPSTSTHSALSTHSAPSPQPPSLIHQAPSTQPPTSSQMSPSPQPSSSPQVATSNSKGDGFSLNQVSKDKCIIKGKNQGLVPNMVYQIRSPKDGSFVHAVWTGEKFEERKKEDRKAGKEVQPVRSSNVQDQLDGNVKAEIQTDIKVEIDPLPDKKIEKETTLDRSLGRVPHVGGKQGSEVQLDSNMSVDVPKSSSDPKAQTKSGVTTPNSMARPAKTSQLAVEGSDSTETEDMAVFKKPFPENEEYVKICQFCGCASRNYRRCESCLRVFRGDIKLQSVKRLPERNSPAPSGPEGRMGPTGTPSAPSLQRLDNTAPGFDQKIRSPVGNKSQVLRVDPKELYRGSMFENEASEDSSTGVRIVEVFGQCDSAPVKRTHDQMEPADLASGKRFKKFPESENPMYQDNYQDEDDDDEDYDDEEPMFHPSHLPAPPPIEAGGGRFAGHSMMPPFFDMSDDEDDDDHDDDDDSDDIPMYEIDIRSVRVGSMRTQPEGPLLINMQGASLRVRSERTDESFECEIQAQDVEKVKYFSGETQPLLFLRLTQESGEKLRNIFHMEPGSDEYFDPMSTDMKQNMVVIIIEGFSIQLEEMLRETLTLWADLNQVRDDVFIEELTDESSNDLLIQSAPPVRSSFGQKDLGKYDQRYYWRSGNMAHPSRSLDSPSGSPEHEPDSTSGSPPDVRSHYFLNPITLLQYPPPPARRLTVTTGDIFCLTEGEFLNDVIIDFYLQYLYLEKLSEENRKRTHIFSSFFYKRLTQRDRHNERSEEDAKKSLPERRHCRVKKWTKTVDLFSKDFIVIPINEHSHWYLAVVCYPGLTGPEPVPFIPSDVHEGEFDDETNSTSTILGQHLDPQDNLESFGDKYRMGQKQPCILMFDSLAGPSRSPNVRILKDYFQCEWNAKKSEPRPIMDILQSCSPNVPQQNNFSDCGVYLLQYVESFFEDPIGDFQIPIKGLQNWFPEEIVDNKRREIHELIMSLHRQYQTERGDPNIFDLKFESAPREDASSYYPHYDEEPPEQEDDMSSDAYGDEEHSNFLIPRRMSRVELPASYPVMEEDSNLEAEEEVDDGQQQQQHMEASELTMAEAP